MTTKEFIKKYDTENQVEVLKDSYKQIEYAWKNEFDLGKLVEKKFKSVVVTGLGGSAISGDVLQNFLHSEINVPFFVNRSYSLPTFANKQTLVIVSSYSGNTEETISVLEHAIKNKCEVICIGAGGKTEEMAKQFGFPFVKLEKGFQPRFALYINFFSLLKVFQKLNFIKPQDDVVEKIIALIKSKSLEYSSEENFAVETAKSLIGFIPIIYSAVDLTSAVGNRFKCQINENAKLNAFNNVIPELNHNEIIGWETFFEKQFAAKVVNILDKDYHPQIIKRFQITSELIEKVGVEIINLKSDQETFKERIFDLIYLGDWISYYLAVFRGQNPISIKNINILKERLAKE
ncbi:MAG: bifunctional phosphoglucose/phosphomannose isomerase [Ignavibacteriales bacterium]|nr:bifunctional phosphoglucose/phosphomannose isomerase [Ignavibacteriales bacterium]